MGGAGLVLGATVVATFSVATAVRFGAILILKNTNHLLFTLSHSIVKG